MIDTYRLRQLAGALARETPTLSDAVNDAADELDSTPPTKGPLDNAR